MPGYAVRLSLPALESARSREVSAREDDFGFLHDFRLARQNKRPLEVCAGVNVFAQACLSACLKLCKRLDSTIVSLF